METDKVLNWEIDQELHAQFLIECELPSDSWRRSDAITTVIENPAISRADHIYQNIKTKYPYLIPYFGRFYTSDLYGNPVTKEFEGVQLSATTLRYIETAGMIQDMIGVKEPARIVEIGGGYGGQCKILHDIYEIEKYTIYDIPSVSHLQKVFLSLCNLYGVDLKNEVTGSGNYDLCISWCGWSELSRDLKELYCREVIASADHIFIASNFNPKEDEEILSEYFDLKKEVNENGRGIYYA